MSNLVEHANRELDILGYPQLTRAEMRGAFVADDQEGWDKMVRKAVIELVTAFAHQGHSGGSAPMVIGMLHELLQFNNLGPITDNPDHWFKVDEAIGGPSLYQSKRNPAMFSSDGGKTYYNLDDKRSKTHQWASRHLPIWLRSLVWRDLNPVHMLPMHESAHADAE